MDTNKPPGDFKPDSDDTAEREDRAREHLEGRLGELLSDRVFLEDLVTLFTVCLEEGVWWTGGKIHDSQKTKCTKDLQTLIDIARRTLDGNPLTIEELATPFQDPRGQITFAGSLSEELKGLFATIESFKEDWKVDRLDPTTIRMHFKLE